jgi:hypothetical protein
MISLRHNFLFVHVPKTAGNSIQNVLKAHCDDQIVCLEPHHDGVERFEVRNPKYALHKHSTLRDYYRELGKPLFDKLFKFSCVRNPWERMISFYFSPSRGKVVWDRAGFLDLVQKTPPLPWHFGLGGNEAEDGSSFENLQFIMRFERIGDDFKTLCLRIGIPHQGLAVRNKSARQHYSAYYDSELTEAVRQRFEREIEYFGYGFEKR